MKPHIRHRSGALFLAALIFVSFLLSACSGSGGGKVIKYDIPSGVSTLDPQRATDETARMIISNTFEGLFRQLSTGEVIPCIAESYDISSDNLTYTFHLRSDAVWSNGEPVTANDFVFAISRLFDPSSFSPFAGQFASVKNAKNILEKNAPQSSLGIYATDAQTLKVELIRPDALLPELLASSYAMPCNEKFFLETRARYGLDLENLIFNGPFSVKGWNNESSISLRANGRYRDTESVIAAGVELYTSSDELSSTERFLNGDTDACKVDYQTLQAVKQDGGQIASFEDTVWVLAFNLNDPQLANPEIRKSLAYSVDPSLFEGYLPNNLRSGSVLIPPAVSIMGHPFREYAGENSTVAFSAVLVRRSLESGLAELGIDKISINEILVCDDASQPLLAGFVQKNFQKLLSLSTGLVKLPREEMMKRVSAGDFQIAVIPLSASYSSPDSILSYFRSDNEQNFTGYKNQRFDDMLNSTAALSGEAQSDVYRQAEQLLLADCPVVPLYFETTYYALAPGVENIDFSPFLSGISFRDAKKK